MQFSITMNRIFTHGTQAFIFFCLFPSLEARAEMRQFTDVEGRTLQAEIISAAENSIQLKLKSGKTATIEMVRLSDRDQAYVKEWQVGREAERKVAASKVATEKRKAEIPLLLTAYCKQQLGKQVGNGECWTLANEAFKACGLSRPGGELRVWGRLLDLKKEPLQPGDIVEYRSAKFSNGSYTGPEHTTIVVKGGKRGIVIAEQNWGGNKTVRESDFDPNSLISGKIMVYRPE